MARFAQAARPRPRRQASLIGLAVQHRGGEPRNASELAIGPMDLRLPDLGAPAQMQRAAERGDGLPLWHGGDVVCVHLQPVGLLAFGQGQRGGDTAQSFGKHD